jgi:hypothetical protein
MANRGTGKPCSFPGCGQKVAARGLCSGHYLQWQKSDDGKLKPLRKRHATSQITFRVRHEIHAMIEALAAKGGTSKYAVCSALLTNATQSAAAKELTQDELREALKDGQARTAKAVKSRTK